MTNDRKPSSGHRPNRSRGQRQSQLPSRNDPKKLVIRTRGRTNHLKKSLREGHYIVFDIETTGGNPERNCITEIFAIKVHNGEVVDTFHSMVDPQMRIPPIVRKMTGITNRMLEGEPTIDQVMPEILAFCGEDVLVSHNTIGDMKFLRYFSKKFSGSMMDNYFLCTHLLTEKLIPTAPDKSLKGLAEHLKLEVKGKLHRATADAHLTHKLFDHLVDKLEQEGMESISEAIRFQGDYESSIRLGWGIPNTKIRELPADPGVFYLYDKKGKVLFLSSAKDIGRDVRSLTKLSYLPKQLIKTVMVSCEVVYETANTAFAASLNEAKELEAHELRFLPSDWHQRVSSFVFLRNEGKDVRLGIGPLAEGVRFALGPVRGGKELVPFLAKIAEVFGKKSTRKGVLLTRNEGALVESLLRQEIKDTLNLPLFPPLLLLKRFRQKWQDQNEQIKDLQSIRIPRELKGLSTLSGVLGVPGVGGWELYSISSGVPSSEGFYDGSLEMELLKAEGKRCYHKILKQRGKLFRKPLDSWEARSLNRVFWWVVGGPKKKEVMFLPVAELEP